MAVSSHNRRSWNVQHKRYMAEAAKCERWTESEDRKRCRSVAVKCNRRSDEYIWWRPYGNDTVGPGLSSLAVSNCANRFVNMHTAPSGSKWFRCNDVVTTIASYYIPRSGRRCTRHFPSILWSYIRNVKTFLDDFNLIIIVWVKRKKRLKQFNF